MSLYFLRLGALGFGGPVALANSMRTDLVERRHWLTEAEYDDGLAIAAACPGPLAYQLGVYCGRRCLRDEREAIPLLLQDGALGLRERPRHRPVPQVVRRRPVPLALEPRVPRLRPGALAATVGIFSPAVLFTVFATPLLLRYRENRWLSGFIRGVTVAVVGVLAGTTYLVAKTAVGDWLTLAITLASLTVIVLWPKLPEPLLVGVGATIGLVAYPILQPGWVLG